MSKLKSGVPRRYVQLTGGHGSANNNNAGALRRDFTLRWFDRFLRGEKNDVDKEPLAEVAVLPNETSVYNSANSQWKHRRSNQWPIVGTRRLFLRSGGRLMATAPTGTETGPKLQHRIKPGYTLLTYASVDEGEPSKVLKSIPLQSVVFQTQPFSGPQELLGRTIVEFEVFSTPANYQLSAALFDVPPKGNPRFITNGVAAKRKVAKGRHRLRIELGDVGYILRKGHRLALAVENLNLRRHPNNANFFATPDFENGDFTIAIDTKFPPRVLLPLNPAGPSLLPRISRVSAAGGFTQPFRIAGETSRSGNVYQLFFSASGNTPGVKNPIRAPLNVDQLTMVGLSIVNTPLCKNFAGTLDASGNATATLQLPAYLAYVLIGHRLTFCAGGITKNNQFFATNHSELIVEQ